MPRYMISYYIQERIEKHMVTAILFKILSHILKKYTPMVSAEIILSYFFGFTPCPEGGCNGITVQRSYLDPQRCYECYYIHVYNHRSSYSENIEHIIITRWFHPRYYYYMSSKKTFTINVRATSIQEDAQQNITNKRNKKKDKYDTRNYFRRKNKLHLRQRKW